MTDDDSEASKICIQDMVSWSDLSNGNPSKCGKPSKIRSRKPSIISTYGSIAWPDLELAAKYNNDYRENVFRWVENRLGYRPHEAVIMPYMAIAQSIIKNTTEGTVPLITASEEFTQLCIAIRRDDMHKGDWVKDTFDAFSKDIYDTKLKEYKQKARDRLCDFLCEDVPVEYSFLAEIYLRYIFTFEDYHEGMKYCSMDMKAGTIALYRRAYQTKGQEAADNLLFIAAMYSYYNPHGQLEDDD